MFTRRTVLLLFGLAPTLPFIPAPAARAQTSLPPSGQVFTCNPDQGCTEETFGDHHYFNFEAPRFTLRVTLRQVHNYNLADITIVNHTRDEIRLKPSDFHIEVQNPNPQRLGFIDMAKLDQQTDRDFEIRKHKPKDRGLPPVAFFQQFAETHPAAVQPSTPSLPMGPLLLAGGSLAPAHSASGRVYFEHSNSATSMNLILPIAGDIFEFPYSKPAPAPSSANLDMFRQLGVP